MKILCIAPTFVPSLDGPTYVNVNEVIEVEPDTGKAVVIAGKGLFVEKKDDMSPAKNFTASSEQIAVAKKAYAEAKKAAELAAKAETPPEA